MHCSLIVPPKFAGKFISSTFDQDQKNRDLRDVGLLISAVTIVKNFPVGCLSDARPTNPI